MTQKFLKLENGKVKQEVVNTSPFSISCILTSEQLTVPDCRQMLVFSCLRIDEDGCLILEDGSELAILG